MDRTGDMPVPMFFLGLPLDLTSVILLPLLLPYEVMSKLPLTFGSRRSGLPLDGDLMLAFLYCLSSNRFARISISNRSSESA